MNLDKVSSFLLIDFFASCMHLLMLPVSCLLLAGDGSLQEQVACQRSPCRWKSTGVHGTLMLAVKRQYEVTWCIDPGGLDDN